MPRSRFQALKTQPVLSSWLCNQSRGRGLCVQRQQLGFKDTWVIVLQLLISLFLNVCFTSEHTPGTYNHCAIAVPSPSAGPVLGLSLLWQPPVTTLVGLGENHSYPDGHGVTWCIPQEIRRMSLSPPRSRELVPSGAEVPMPSGF